MRDDRVAFGIECVCTLKISLVRTRVDGSFNVAAEVFGAPVDFARAATRRQISPKHNIGSAADIRSPFSGASLCP